jgi:translation initiation factor 1
MKNNPFGNLRKELGLPEPPAAPAESRETGAQGAPGLRDFDPRDFDTSRPKRAVVRYERSGRGGKDVTVIEQLGIPDAELQTWLKQLKAALGCGGSIEGDAIMLQGDHRKRLSSILTERGVIKISVG